MTLRASSGGSAASAGSSAGASRAEWVLRVDLTGWRPRGPADGPEVRDAPSSLDGYALEPDRTVIVAVVTEGSSAASIFETLWQACEREGTARHRFARTDDRGRTVTIFGFGPLDSTVLLPLIRETLVLPVRCHRDEAEITCDADATELAQVESALRAAGLPVAMTSRTGLEAPNDRLGMSNEDWAFLGLLEAAGAHDPDRPVDRFTLVDRLGMNPVRFEERVLDVERGLNGLVSDVFVAPESLPGSGLTPPLPPSGDPFGLGGS